MESLKPLVSPAEFARRGQTYYEEKIQPHVKETNRGKFVAIDIETGEFEIDVDDYTATERLLQRLPGAQIWLCRAGQRTTYRIGGYPSSCASSRSNPDKREAPMKSYYIYKCKWTNTFFFEFRARISRSTFRICFFAVLFPLLFLSPLTSDSQEAGKQIKMASGTYYDYLLYLPKTYGRTDKSWPMLLFLHGYRDSGSNDADEIRKGWRSPASIVENEEEMLSLFGEEGFPFILVSPYCRPGRWWWNQYLDQVMDEVLTIYSVDRQRVYVTGFSMGGFGSWSYASVHSDLFAAVVPICGASDASRMSSGLKMTPPAALEKLVDTPIWAFHAKDDPTVPFSSDEKTVNELRAMGGEVKFTALSGGGHGIWGDIYMKKNYDIYTWMLSHLKLRTGITVPLYHTGNVLAVGLFNSSNTSDDLAGSAEVTDNQGSVYVSGELGTWIPNTEFRWKAVYFKEGSGQEESGWNLRDFDDSLWNLNTSLGFPIGYETGEAEGKIDIKVDPSIQTLYTRSIFDVQKYDSVTELTIKIAGDDAAVVWLNGVYIGVTGEGISAQKELPRYWKYDTTTRNDFYGAWDLGDPFAFRGPATTQVKVKVDLVEKTTPVRNWELY